MKSTVLLTLAAAAILFSACKPDDPNPTRTVCNTESTVSSLGTNTYTFEGELLTGANVLGSTRYGLSYNSGRLSTINETDINTGFSSSTTFQYNNEGRVSVAREFDGLNGQGTLLREFTYSYLNNNNVFRIRVANLLTGIVDSLELFEHVNGRPTVIRRFVLQDSTLLSVQTTELDYDAEGNQTAVRSTAPGSSQFFTVYTATFDANVANKTDLAALNIDLYRNPNLNIDLDPELPSLVEEYSFVNCEGMQVADPVVVTREIYNYTEVNPTTRQPVRYSVSAETCNTPAGSESFQEKYNCFEVALFD